MHDAKRRAAEGEDLEGLRKAVELRNRLLEYDKQAANLTHVVDDDNAKAGADYSQWDTEEERALALETARAEEIRAHEDARRRVLALDLGTATATMDRLAPTLSGAPLRVFQVLQRGGAGPNE